ncbi:hypothetical protein GCM10010149_19780 [Nonomuraea roseoviolacea subsp. roseoviolacea]
MPSARATRAAASTRAADSPVWRTAVTPSAKVTTSACRPSTFRGREWRTPVATLSCRLPCTSYWANVVRGSCDPHAAGTGSGAVWGVPSPPGPPTCGFQLAQWASAAPAAPEVTPFTSRVRSNGSSPKACRVASVRPPATPEASMKSSSRRGGASHVVPVRNTPLRAPLPIDASTWFQSIRSRRLWVVCTYRSIPPISPPNSAMLSSSRLASRRTTSLVNRARSVAARSPGPAVAGLAMTGSRVASWKISSPTESLIIRLVYWTCTPRSLSAIAIAARRVSTSAWRPPTLLAVFVTKILNAAPSQASASGGRRPVAPATR